MNEAKYDVPHFTPNSFANTVVRLFFDVLYISFYCGVTEIYGSCYFSKIIALRKRFKEVYLRFNNVKYTTQHYFYSVEIYFFKVLVYTKFIFSKQRTCFELY